MMKFSIAEKRFYSGLSLVIFLSISGCSYNVPTVGSEWPVPLQSTDLDCDYVPKISEFYTGPKTREELFPSEIDILYNMTPVTEKERNFINFILSKIKKTQLNCAFVNMGTNAITVFVV